MYEVFYYVIPIILLVGIFWNYVNEYKRYKSKKSKTNLFVDSEQATIFISPGKYTTDEELKKIIDVYDDIYWIKVVDKDMVITGISKYVVDYTRDKKGSK